MAARPRLRAVPEHDANDLHDYDGEYLECRGLSHPWRGVGFFRDAGYISRLARCQRCGTEKIITMRHDGVFIRSTYRHPEGYSLTNGGVSKQEVRQETIRRAEGQTFDSFDELLNESRRTTKSPRKSS